MISATVAIYPMGQPDFAAVDTAIDVLRAADVALEVRSMQSEISGTEEAVFGALQRAFTAAASAGGVVMTVTVTNACPV